jgi:hypothetical protein
LRETFVRGRPGEHLRVIIDKDGDLWVTVTVLPNVLFLDIQDAMRDARLLDRGLTLKYLSRKRGSNYNFGVAALDQTLRSGGL